MKFRLFIVAALFAALAAPPARAVELDTVVDSLTSSEGGAGAPTLTIGMAAQGTDKGAGLVIHAPDKDAKNPGADIVVGFFTREEWRQFVALWDRARAAKPQAGAASEIGRFQDSHDQVLLRVSAMPGGAVELGAVGKANGVVTGSLFNLAPKDFAAFDKDVKAVTAYFEP